MPGKILVIEDDPTSLRLIEYALKQRGYQVLTTLNGLEGIITAQKEAPDLIMLDIMLPGIDGFEVCRRLHASSQTAKTPILIISAKTQKEDINAGFKAGADDYLLKPASPTEIINRVESLLSKKMPSQARIIPFISYGNVPGMATIIVNIAAALAEQGKQVSLVDASGGRDGNGIQNTAILNQPNNAPKPDSSGNSSGNDSQGSDVITLPSGMRVLHINQTPNVQDVIADGGFDLIKRIGKNCEYLLVISSLMPTTFTKSLLTGSDLVILMNDYRVENIVGTKNTITLLSFLGIKPEKIATLLVDPEGKQPNLTVANLKPYIEANLGITLAEVISYDAKIYHSSYMDNQTIIQSNQNPKLAQDIRQIARYIITYNYTKEDLKPLVSEIPTLERRN
jgi:CheY-like chemotaxis protein/MinD-like ATPase involved in chromosome partitioning or flagellar assembly